MPGRRCRKIVEITPSGEQILCDGIFTTRHYMSYGITYEYEACVKCGDRPTLEDLILKERQIRKQTVPYD